MSISLKSYAGFFESFIDSSAWVILKSAWPTAKYVRADPKGVHRYGDKYEVTFRIHARSYWTDGPLWVDAIAVFSDSLELIDLHFGDYYAVLPPGSAWQALSELSNK